MDITAWLSSIAPDRGDSPLESRSGSIGAAIDHEPRLSYNRYKASEANPPTTREQNLRQVVRSKGYKDRSRYPVASSSAANDRSSISAQSQVKPPRDEKFERRPRHKTRPDIYEPNAGVRKPRSKPVRNQNPKRKPKDGSHDHARNRRRPGHRLVNDFYASNVTQSRLTLQPTDSLGLFRKGHVSAPLKGQGRRNLHQEEHVSAFANTASVPDLVFSDTHFVNADLKRGAKEDAAAETQQQKRSRRERFRKDENEVSNFFSRDREPLRPNSGNINSKRNSRNSPNGDSSHCSDVQDNVRYLSEPISKAQDQHHGSKDSSNEHCNRMSSGLKSRDESCPGLLPAQLDLEIGQLDTSLGYPSRKDASAYQADYQGKMHKYADELSPPVYSAPAAVPRFSGDLSEGNMRASMAEHLSAQDQISRSRPQERQERQGTPISTLLDACDVAWNVISESNPSKQKDEYFHEQTTWAQTLEESADTVASLIRSSHSRPLQDMCDAPLTGYNFAQHGNQHLQATFDNGLMTNLRGFEEQHCQTPEPTWPGEISAGEALQEHEKCSNASDYQLQRSLARGYEEASASDWATNGAWQTVADSESEDAIEGAEEEDDVVVPLGFWRANRLY